MKEILIKFNWYFNFKLINNMCCVVRVLYEQWVIIENDTNVKWPHKTNILVIDNTLQHFFILVHFILSFYLQIAKVM